MKRYLKFLFLGLTTGLLFSSCATNNVRLRVMRPAVIDVPKDIQKLSLANRYKPKKPNRVLNVLEGLITGEGIGTDRRGAEASLQGLAEVLAESPRFSSTQLPVQLEGTGMANFPEPLSPEEVKRLCDMASADALVTIEAFDSDSDMNYGTREKTEKVDGESTKVTYHTVDAALRVTVGWRMYRASDGTLVDQFRMIETIHFREEGRSQEAARRALPNKERITQRVGQVVGNAYATRISPAWFWVSRSYFTKAKKTPEMKIARNSARVNDWEGAAKIWNALSANPNPKVSRRAMYNMAVAAEVLGDIDSAIHWTEEAYKLGLNRALDYNRILRHRKMELQRLDQQLSE
jgi:hypothetical protein